MCARVCASSNAPSCSRSTTTSRPTLASAPRPGGSVRGHTTRVGTAVAAAAAMAVAALPSDRPCPATGHPRQGLRRTPATAQRTPTPRANPGPQAAYEHEANPAPRAFVPSPPQSTSPPVPVASVPRRVPRRQMSARSLQRPARPPTRLSAQARLGDTRPPSGRHERSAIRP